MKVGSLFSGGGLGDYGFELAGYEIVFQVEIDDYCQKILKLRWPDVPKYGDIREVKGKDLPYCDILIGGFPCQDISVANHAGKGIEGEKSGLWKEYFRIICEIRPKYILVENVSALLIRGLDVVLRDLASVGYNAEWECISASAFGAPHKRDRVWIVAYDSRSRIGNCETIFAGRGDMGKYLKPNRQVNWNGIQVDRSNDKTICSAYTDTKLLRVDDGITTELERLKLLGNGQVVQCVQWIAERIMEYERTI